MGLFGKSKKKPPRKAKAAPKGKAKAGQAAPKRAKKKPADKAAAEGESWLYQGDKEAMIRAALANVGNPLPRMRLFPAVPPPRPHRPDHLPRHPSRLCLWCRLKSGVIRSGRN